MNPMRREALLLVALAFALFPQRLSAQICFQRPTSLILGEGLGPGLNELIAADFNRDGFLDLAGTTPEADSAVVLLGNGNGTFGPASFFPVGDFPSSLVTGHFNGDTMLDLAVVNNNAGTVSILLGTGAGDFTLGSTIGLSALASAIAAGDFNGDGRTDLVATEIGGVELLLADTSGGFELSGVFPAGPPLFSDSLVVDDFNRDGRLDIAVANSVGNVVVILLGNGNGDLGAPLVIPVGEAPFAVVAGEFNGDSKIDLAVANRGNGAPGSSDVAILLGNGDGTFSGPTRYPGAGARDVAVGDVDRDGDQDLAVANQSCCLTDPSGPAISILPGDGNGGFGSPSNFEIGPTSGPIAVVLGDFNRDGLLDAAVGDSGSRIWIYLACAPIPEGIPTLNPHGLILMGALLALVAVGRLTARG